MGNLLSGNATVVLDMKPSKKGSYSVAFPFATLEGNFVMTDSSKYFLVYLYESKQNSRNSILFNQNKLDLTISLKSAFIKINK